ncbi:TPA: hypothetical protein ACQJW2_005105 [Citrobacter braakii]
MFSVHASEIQSKKRDPVPVPALAAAVSRMCIDHGAETDPVKMRESATELINIFIRKQEGAELSEDGEDVAEAFVTRSKSPSDIPSHCEVSVNERYWEIVKEKK